MMHYVSFPSAYRSADNLYFSAMIKQIKQIYPRLALVAN